MNKKKGQTGTSTVWVAIIFLLIGGLIGWYIKKPGVSNPNMKEQPAQIQNASQTGAARQGLMRDMRKLWEDHVTWTRMYLVSAAYDNSDTSQAATRLLKNQEDIGNYIKAFYGEDAGNKLTALLKEHINLAVAIVKAVKTNDNQALNMANTKWYDNANQIADSLSSLNSNWPKDVLRKMMKDHLDLTKQEALDILNKKYEAGVADYDSVHNEILAMADALSDGIIKQFPNRF